MKVYKGYDKNTNRDVFFLKDDYDYVMVLDNGYYAKEKYLVLSSKPFNKGGLKLKPTNQHKLFSIVGHENSFIMITKNGKRLITPYRIFIISSEWEIMKRPIWVKYCEDNNLPKTIAISRRIKSVTIKNS